MEERLQKVMAELGVASRRKCEELILQGRVKVNCETVSELGFKADKDIDSIEVDGRLLVNKDERVYVLLNKPIGYITSAHDQFGRPTVLDLVKGVNLRIFPVGRLDYDTSGLLLLTNDGDLTFKITHPRHNIDKTYRAQLKGMVDEEDVRSFAEGVLIDGDFRTSPAGLVILKAAKTGSLVDITIHEGRNRQVRKMCSAIGHEVIRLTRTNIGKISIGDLKTGQWRYLTANEIKYLKDLGGAADDSDTQG